MKHKNRDAPVEFVPNWQRTMAHQHQLQMRAHQDRFGKLGELQTKAQKTALKRALQGSKP